jgi:hypothetical protein
MNAFQIPAASLTPSKFPHAASLASVVSPILSTFNDINTILPAAMTNKGADATTPNQILKTNACMFDSNGNINPSTYLNMVVSIENFRYILSQKQFFSGIPADKIRIVFTDANKTVGFDSAKMKDKGAVFDISMTEALDVSNNAPSLGTNKIQFAFPKIYESVNLINECHVGRVEFEQAELASNSIGINRRWSGTLKTDESRAVFALKSPSGNVTGLLAVSIPAV